jgi:hypothetical protein
MPPDPHIAFRNFCDSSGALVTLDRLNEASAGWATWEVGTADVTDASPCRRKVALGPEPSDKSMIQHYHVKAKADASLEQNRFASRTDANVAMQATVAEFESCPEKTLDHFSDVSADLEVVAFVWGTGNRRGVVWLVNVGDRMDILRVVGVRPPATDVLDRISRLLAADVQVP